MKVETDKGHEVTARQLMHNILYDNGAVNRWEPETLKRYPEKHFKAITAACENFFDAHPEFLTDEDLENIAAGELEENKLKYGIHPEYAALDDALNEYFEVM